MVDLIPGLQASGMERFVDELSTLLHRAYVRVSNQCYIASEAVASYSAVDLGLPRNELAALVPPLPGRFSLSDGPKTVDRPDMEGWATITLSPYEGRVIPVFF
jgi:hypothetical protein